MLHFVAKGTDVNIQNFKEYNDIYPISLDGFTDEQIYCRSYLERIINSFNK